MAAPEVKNVNKNIDRDFDLFRITHGKKLNQEGHNLILSGEFFVRKDEKLLKRFESNPIGNLVHVRDLLGPAFHGFCIDADPPFAAETGLHNPDPDVWVWLHTQNEKIEGPEGVPKSLEEWRNENPDNAHKYVLLTEFVLDHDRFPRSASRVRKLEEGFGQLYH